MQTDKAMKGSLCYICVENTFKNPYIIPVSCKKSPYIKPYIFEGDHLKPCSLIHHTLHAHLFSKLKFT